MRRLRRVLRALAAVAFVLLVALAPGQGLAADIEVPAVTAQGVFAFDPATGEVILEQDAGERLPIGSVTKVMTALVVVDNAALDEEVTIQSMDMVGEGYSAMGLQPGDTLTVEQLLTGMLVVSGGDAAKALARHAGAAMAGDDDPGVAVDAFVEAMNERAATLRMDDTRFANPDGADDEDGWSTARDVAIMFAFLQANPVLAGMSAQVEYAFTSVGPEATPYAGASTNQLAGADGVLSAKTGSTLDAGGCLVLAREGTGGQRHVIAILGSDLEYDEMWNPVVDERWTDAQVIMAAIDTHWTPGQDLAAVEPTEAPEPTAAMAADGPPAGAPAPQPTLADDAAEPGSPSSRPLVALTAASGILAFAAVFAWSRIPPRPPLQS